MYAPTIRVTSSSPSGPPTAERKSAPESGSTTSCGLTSARYFATQGQQAVPGGPGRQHLQRLDGYKPYATLSKLEAAERLSRVRNGHGRRKYRRVSPETRPARRRGGRAATRWAWPGRCSRAARSPRSRRPSARRGATEDPGASARVGQARRPSHGAPRHAWPPGGEHPAPAGGPSRRCGQCRRARGRSPILWLRRRGAARGAQMSSLSGGDVCANTPWSFCETPASGSGTLADCDLHYRAISRSLARRALRLLEQVLFWHLVLRGPGFKKRE